MAFEDAHLPDLVPFFCDEHIFVVLGCVIIIVVIIVVVIIIAILNLLSVLSMMVVTLLLFFVFRMRPFKIIPPVHTTFAYHLFNFFITADSSLILLLFTIIRKIRTPRIRNFQIFFEHVNLFHFIWSLLFILLIFSCRLFGLFCLILILMLFFIYFWCLLLFYVSRIYWLLGYIGII